MGPFTCIGPVKFIGHPVNCQSCWALQTGIHHHLKNNNKNMLVTSFNSYSFTSFRDQFLPFEKCSPKEHDFEVVIHNQSQ